ncbi:HEXXH motif domain-containing protein [Nocardia tengchongensis]|uniref:HEXXH motif domain-containing protein n=1 Tax=Nocardia tengchongensis TaxID=2055889 RepID=UPI00369368BC
MSVTTAEIGDLLADSGSGHGSESGVAQLTAGLLTMRMIMLSTLISTVDDELAEASGLLDAYQQLAELQTDHPAVVSSMLSYPNTGPWLTRVLRRISDELDDADAPLWADCAYLGWLAATASIACREQGTARLVIRNGVVMLPTLGLARLGDAEHCGPCELRWTATGTLHFSWPTGSARVESVTSESDPGWLPLRWMRGADDEPRVWLDDLDPFRSLLPAQSTPPRLTADQAGRWQHDFAEAWQLLRGELGAYVAPMREVLTTMAPLSVAPLVASTSHTAFNGTGCVYTTAPADPCQLALTLIHEIQHTKFALLTDQVELFAPDSVCRFYAPWRDDPRPILGLLHGIYAFFGVTDFWRAHRHSDCHGSVQAHADFELWRVQVSGAIEQATASGLLSDEGRGLLDSLTAAMAPWRTEELPPAARQAAAESAAAHRTFWQIRNLAPDPAGIDDLLARWDAGRPANIDLPSAALLDQDRIPDRYRRLPLAAQLKTLDPVAAEALSISGQPAGDRAYLAGYLTEAVALYSRELRADPLRPQAWAGLYLAGSKLFGGKNFDVLGDRGEVVARLYEAAGPETDPIDLLRWLSTPETGRG